MIEMFKYDNEQTLYDELDLNYFLKKMIKYYETDDLKIIERGIKRDLKNFDTGLKLLEEFDFNINMFVLFVARNYKTKLHADHREMLRILNRHIERYNLMDDV